MSPQREHSPADPLVWDFWLQNYGRLHVCCFKPPEPDVPPEKSQGHRSG